MTSRKILGKRARTYGHTFEREIVNRIKLWFEHRWWAKDVRRSDQTHRAHLPDVSGVPGVWLELETAAQPSPKKKHAQAVHDSARFADVVPVAIVRKKSSPSIHAHLRLVDLMALFERAAENRKAEGSKSWVGYDDALIQMELADFFNLLGASETPELSRP